MQTETKATGETLNYSYDVNGNRTSVTVTANGVSTTTEYTYDVLNRLATVTDHNAQIASYGYDAVGNKTAIHYPNSNTSTYAYDALNRLSHIEHRNAQNVVLNAFTYTVDATGRRARIEEANGRVTQYTYDNLYRLTDEIITDSINGNYSANYQYDTVGNRIYETVNGVQTQYAYDANDRLSSQGGIIYTYDPQGNTLTETLDGKVKTYSYNAKNQLIAMQATGDSGNSVNAAYAYNINGIRTAKTENGITTHYLVDENTDYAQVLQETTGIDSVIYTLGDDLLSQESNGEFRFYHYDGLGSTRALSDSTGNVTDTYAYEVFGEVLATTGNTENHYQFTGEQYDEGLNQYYLRARYYNPNSGRFTQQDSYLGNNTDPVTLHKYLYANVDPANVIDPSGKFGLVESGIALDVAGTIASYQIQSSLDFLGNKLAGTETGDQIQTVQNAAFILGIASMGSAGIKLLQMGSKKFRGACRPTNSFDGDTLVETEDGLRPIAEIKIGDRVWSYNDKTGEKTLEKVVHLISREGEKDIVELRLNNGDVIDATAGHPFYVQSGDAWQWLDAGDLTVTSLLMNMDGQATPIEEISKRKESLRVYNLTVDNTHTYYVGESGVLSHNANEGCEIWKHIWGKRNKNKFINNMSSLPFPRGVKPGPDYEAHHIVPIDATNAAKLQERLARAGINGNDGGNGVWMSQDSHRGKGSGMHSKAYISYLENRLEGFEDKESILMILDQIAVELSNGIKKF